MHTSSGQRPEVLVVAKVGLLSGGAGMGVQVCHPQANVLKLELHRLVKLQNVFAIMGKSWHLP
jgi:hypothetical protein